MDSRKEKLLSTIVQEYTKTAQPVGSSWVVDNCDFQVSPATIRNEMSDLEAEGFIYQPYTSAGRVPTTKGFKYYIDNFLEKKELTAEQEKSLRNIMAQSDKGDLLLKNLAKLMAELAEQAVIVAFQPQNIFYTGIANLLQKPEFARPELIYNMGLVIDHLDRRVSEIFNQIEEEAKIMIGEENPFDRNCGSILARYEFSGGNGMMGIVGPIRMDYSLGLGLIKSAQDLLREFNTKQHE